MSSSKWRSLFMAASISAAASVTAAPDNQTLTLVVGLAPGGGVDTVARVVAQEMSKVMNRSVIVENKPGAGGIIAAQDVARSPAAAARYLFSGPSTLIGPYVQTVTYDLDKDFVPVGLVGGQVLAVAVSASTPFRTFEDLLQAAKEKPGSLSYASTGMGSQHHLAGEQLSSLANIDMVHVPYKGASQAAQDLSAGHIPVAITSLTAVMPQVEAGKIRILAVMSPQRMPELPDIPSVAETFPGFESVTSLFVLAPANADPQTVDRMAQALEAALRAPNVKEALRTQYSLIDFRGPEATREWMNQERKRWEEVVRKANVRLD